MQLIFARNCEDSNVVREEPLFINNCGYHLDITQNMKIFRARGRVDYHLIFVHRGSLHTNFGKVKAGECVYYKPNEAQCYEYIAEEKSAYFWVHYSGKEAESMFEGKSSGIIGCGVNAPQIHELFLRMVKGIREKFFQCERYAVGIFQATCALVLGGEKERSPFRSVISMMHEYSNRYTVANYAEKAKMSKEHFIRSFKTYTGKTPLEYRTDILIDYAKNLLMETTLSIGEIGEMAGFSDGLYFSRLFKKKVGLSPSEFRRAVNTSS